MLEPGTIVKDRFVKSFKLSNGALTLAPFKGVTPSLSSAEQTMLWATDGLSGTVEGVGFADVTLNRSMTHLLSAPAITALDETPSLVGLTRSDEINRRVRRKRLARARRSFRSAKVGTR